MTKIEHIVFDVGQVLLHWDADLIYTDLIPDTVERSDFLTNVCSSAWNVEQDRGRDWTVAEDELIAEFPDKAELIRAFRPNWHRSVPYAHTEVAAIMDGLIESGYDVTILSNFNQHTYVEAMGKYPFLDHPRGATVSGDIGLIKPDQAIYSHHTREFDLAPEKTLFLDDSAANIEGARAFGWHAVQFFGKDGRSRLSQILSEAGITLDN